jgi:predicted aspartyl protease
MLPRYAGLLSLAVMMLVGVTGSARAGDTQSPGKTGAAADVTEAPGPLYAAPTRLDQAGRVLAAVEINGQGPLRFIVDTGANRSALTPRTVARLGLTVQPESAVYVQGVTGAAPLPSVEVDSLKAGEILIPRRRLPVLSTDIFGGADGILGIEGLEDARLEVDFARDSVIIAPSTGKRMAAESLVVPVTLDHGGLLMAKGQMGRITVQVVIDTGAERTLGNLPLRDALMHRIASDRRYSATVLGATPEIANGVSFRAPPLKIGQARLANLPVTFGDLHVFEVWGLAKEPALIIGMDLLGTLRRFSVDYRRKELQLTTYQDTMPNVKKCGPNECGTRLPPPH